MYTPTYILWLDSVERDTSGWPKFVDQEAREWAIARVKKILQQAQGPLPLRIIADYLLRHPNKSEIPECLRNIQLWDAIHGVTYRALLAADCQQVWVGES